MIEAGFLKALRRQQERIEAVAIAEPAKLSQELQKPALVVGAIVPQLLGINQVAIAHDVAELGAARRILWQTRRG